MTPINKLIILILSVKFVTTQYISVKCQYHSHEEHKINSSHKPIVKRLSIVIEQDKDLKILRNFQILLDDCLIKEIPIFSEDIETFKVPEVRSFNYESFSAVLFRRNAIPVTEDDVSDLHMKIILMNYKLEEVTSFLQRKIPNTPKSEDSKNELYTPDVDILYIQQDLSRKVVCSIGSTPNKDSIYVHCEDTPNELNRITFINTKFYFSNRDIEKKIVVPKARNLQEASRNISINNIKIILIYDSNIPIFFENSLENLNIQTIQIKNCSTQLILPKAFQHISTEYLEITQNNIEILRNYIFNKVTVSQRIELEYNNIVYIQKRAFEGLTASHLDLSNNKIKEIDRYLWGIQGLKHLIMSYNEISVVPRGTFNNLSWVNLAFNKIHTIESGSFQHMQQASTITLLQNTLTHIKSDMFDNLNAHSLNLNQNNIKCIVGDAFKNSTFYELSLNYNKLHRITKNMFVNASIGRLNLIENNIRDIEKGSFDVVEGLTVIDLERNKLDILKTGSITGEKLEVIHLRGNNITKIEADVFEGARLYLIRMDGERLDEESKRNLQRYGQYVEYR